MVVYCGKNLVGFYLIFFGDTDEAVLLLKDTVNLELSRLLLCRCLVWGLPIEVTFAKCRHFNCWKNRNYGRKRCHSIRCVSSPNKKARPIRNALSLFLYVFDELAALSCVELVQE